MWQVVFITVNKNRADNLKNRLTEEGFLVKIEPMGSKETDGYQLLVPEGEALDVAEFLNQGYDFND